MFAAWKSANSFLDFGQFFISQMKAFIVYSISRTYIKGYVFYYTQSSIMCCYYFEIISFIGGTCFISADFVNNFSCSIVA